MLTKDALVGDGAPQAAFTIAVAGVVGARCHVVDTTPWQLGRVFADIVGGDVVVTDADDPLAALRSAVNAGDVIVVLADDEHPIPRELRWRAVAWGASVIWLGWGQRPTPGAADHVLWAESVSDISPRTWLTNTLQSLGSAVALHPAVTGPSDPDPGEVCITCADEGIVMEVVADDGPFTVIARCADGARVVDTTLVGDVAPQDILLVHAGTAISQIDVNGQHS